MKIMTELYGYDIYKNFDVTNINEDLQGWHSEKPLLKELITSIKPKIIIEVGTWKGRSAIFMAKLLKEHHIDCEIICVDTWLGSLENLNARTGIEKHQFWWNDLKHKNGYPQLYYQFLKNVISNECQHLITPIANTSAITSRWLYDKKIKADLIYIDASHDYQDVLDDLTNYFPLLSDKGFICGDDWGWESVKKALLEFADKQSLVIEHYDDQDGWILKRK